MCIPERRIERTNNNNNIYDINKYMFTVCSVMGGVPQLFLRGEGGALTPNWDMSWANTLIYDISGLEGVNQ